MTSNVLKTLEKIIDLDHSSQFDQFMTILAVRLTINAIKNNHLD